MALKSYEEAVAEIGLRVVPVSFTESTALATSAGRVLAQPLIAARANPSFDNSAVDGYLLGIGSAREGETFEVTGEVRAGGESLIGPGPGQSVRIFTGAPVPTGELCVAMQEDVRREGSRLTLAEAVGPAAHIRRAGTDFEIGTKLVEVGTRIGAAEIALAAWNGAAELPVLARPRVAIAVTGDELIPIGRPLLHGQIHDSNGPMLSELGRTVGAEVSDAGSIGDRREWVEERLLALSRESDLIVLSGGASVGDYDHVPAAVAALGEVFWHGVSIKPGKPTLFGKIGSAYVFGLPGNPSSAYVCFELFVRPALRRLSGESETAPIWIVGRFDGDYTSGNRDEFVRVRLSSREDQTWATPVFEQGSFGLRSLAAAQAFARLHRETTFTTGDPVPCMLLPHAR